MSGHETPEELAEIFWNQGEDMTEALGITLEEIVALEALRERYQDDAMVFDEYLALLDVQAPRLCDAARRGVEASDRLTHLEQAYQSAMRVGSEAQRRAKTAETALAEANKEILDTTWEDHADYWQKRAVQAEAALIDTTCREVLLAAECAEAWQSAVDWIAYTSEYFQEKWGAKNDLAKCKAAEARLESIRGRATTQHTLEIEAKLSSALNDVAEAVRREREACAAVCESFIKVYLFEGERWLKGEHGNPDVRIKDLAPHLEAAHEMKQILKHGGLVEANSIAHRCATAIRARNEPAASPAAPIGERDGH